MPNQLNAKPTSPSFLFSEATYAVGYFVWLTITNMANGALASLTYRTKMGILYKKITVKYCILTVIVTQQLSSLELFS